MTTMKRVTIAIPNDLDKKILAIRKTDDYIRLSYSEIVRRVLDLGVEQMQAERDSA